MPYRLIYSNSSKPSIPGSMIFNEAAKSKEWSCAKYSAVWYFPLIIQKTTAYPIIIGLFLVSYIAINKIALAKGQKQPLGLYTIISPSMTPNIQVYDVVFIVKTNPEDIEVGDVISYYSTNAFFGNTPITHRVVEKFSTNQGYTFRTKGDANPVVDNEIISEDNVIGVEKMIIPQLGRVQFFLASKFGWFTIILIPAVGVIIYDIIKLIKLIRVKNKMSKVKQEEVDEDLPTRKRKRTTSVK